MAKGIGGVKVFILLILSCSISVLFLYLSYALRNTHLLNVVSKPGETASTEEAKGQPEVAATLHKLEDQKDSEDDQSISAGKENESDKTPVAEKDDEGEEDGEEHGEEDGEEDAEESTEEELEEPTKRTNADVDDEKKVWRFELTQLHTLCEYPHFVYVCFVLFCFVLFCFVLFD